MALRFLREVISQMNNDDPRKLEFIVDICSLRELFTPELYRASLELISHWSTKHEPPALVNELYKLQLVVESLEDTPLKDLRYAFLVCFYLSVKKEREPVLSSPTVIWK